MNENNLPVVALLAVLASLAAPFGIALATGTPPTIEMFGGAVLFCWLVLVVLYLAWAIRRYNVNYGVTDHEWKVFHPELYAREKELPRYKDLHEIWAQEQEQKHIGRAERRPLEEPRDNPYANDSFGLPPGTVRGILALSATILFVVAELINLFSDRPDEQRFGQLVTAFMMVLAFYFGSKAVDVLKASEKAPPKANEEESGAAAEGTAPVAAPVAQAAPPPPELPLPELEPAAPSERPALPAAFRDLRVAGLALVALPPPAGPPPDGAVVRRGLTSADSLEKRALALTASFETGRPFPECYGVVAGNFDGKGISFGTLQWNLGSGTLQKLLLEMRRRFDDQLRASLGGLYPSLCAMLEQKSIPEQVAWAERIQHTQKAGGRVVWIVEDAWREAFGVLGRTDGMMQLQLEDAASRYDRAVAWCREWRLTTERAVALMFDISVQNGQLERGDVRAQIEADLAQLPASLPPLDAEIEKLVIVAERRAAVCAPAWRKDVLDRKLCIARGEGVVHGRRYELLRDFAIGLRPFEPPKLTVVGAPAAAPKASYSEHFSRGEMLSSQAAVRLQLDNTPDARTEANLERLCAGFLEAVRARFGALRVSSGFRSEAVNKAIGGSRTSAHRFGRAADFVPMDPRVELTEVVDWILNESKLDFDQVILEFGRWVHLGIAEAGKAGRREALMIFEPGKYVPYDPEKMPRAA